METPSLFERLTEFWWVRLPLASRRLNRQLPLILSDGLYIGVWPRVGSWLSMAILLIGLLTGWLSPGFNLVFTESLFVLLLMLLFGFSSSHLGLMFLIGFCAGDFFLGNTSWVWRGSLWQHLWRERLPMVIEYALMAFLCVQVPVLVKRLTHQMRGVVALGQRISSAVAVVGQVGLSLLFVFLLSQSMPLLIRPIFVWTRGQPTPQAVTNLQAQVLWLLFVTAVVVLIRMVLQSLTAFRSPFKDQYTRLLQPYQVAEPVVPWSARLPILFKVSFTSLFSAFMISGIYESWLDGILVGSLTFLLQAVRQRLIPLPLEGWSRLMNRIPLLLRLTLGATAIILLSRAVLETGYRNNSFRPVLIVVLVSMLLFFVLTPNLIAGTGRLEEGGSA